MDFSEEENKLIVSERAIREETAKEELAKLKLGEIVEGEIVEVTDFGAFVRLSDSLDALIHSSEIDWKFVENPRDILHVGDKIKSKIVSLEGGRVSLSLKALKEDPWLKIEDRFTVGQKIKGKILKIKTSIIFVELSAEVIGVLPVAELGGKNPSEVVEIGKEYDMAIVSIDSKEHKLLLTLEKPKETSAE